MVDNQKLSEMLSTLPGEFQDDPTAQQFVKMIWRWGQQGLSPVSHIWTLLILYRRLLRRIIVARDHCLGIFSYVQRQIDLGNTERLSLNASLTADRDLLLDLMNQQAYLEQCTFLLCWGGHLVQHLTMKLPVVMPADYPRISGLLNIKISLIATIVKQLKLEQEMAGDSRMLTVYDLIIRQAEDSHLRPSGKTEAWSAPLFEAHRVFTQVPALPPDAQSMVEDIHQLTFVIHCIAMLAVKRNAQEGLGRYFPQPGSKEKKPSPVTQAVSEQFFPKVSGEHSIVARSSSPPSELEV